MSSRRMLITGLSTYWGGRLAQELERDPAVEAIIGVDTRDPAVELERTEFVRVGTQHALIRRIIAAAEIDTVIDTRLIVDSIVASPRAAHENNVIGTMNILAACGGPDSPVRKFVFKSSRALLRLRAGRPGLLHRGDAAARTRRARRSSATSSRPRRRSATSPSATRDVTVTVLRFANGLGAGPCTTRTPGCSRCRSCPAILGFDPRYQFIHEDDIVGALVHAVREDLPGIYNGAARRGARAVGGAGLLGKPMRRCCRRGARGSRRARCAASGCASPSRCSTSCASGAAWTTAGSRRQATATATRRARRCQRFAEHLRLRPLAARRRRALPLRARGRGVPALEPERAPPRARCREAGASGHAPGGDPRLRRASSRARSSRCCPRSRRRTWKPCAATRRRGRAAARCSRRLNGCWPGNPVKRHNSGQDLESRRRNLLQSGRFLFSCARALSSSSPRCLPSCCSVSVA